MSRTHHRLNCITPPYLLQKLLESGEEDIRRAALNTLVTTAQLRGGRAVRASFAGSAVAPANGRRTIFDCRSGTFLPLAELVRSESDPPVADASVNRAFDGLGATRDFYNEVFHRDSIDDRGMRLQGYVHRGTNYNNAFWDGQEMVFGDGDGIIFTDFTGSLDVIAHELAHGVTEHTAGLEYHDESGALNESLSDAFGAMVKQRALHQTATEADWLIGPEVFTPGIEADALRSMKAPGTAFDNKLFGKDPQPDHMSRLVKLPDTEEGDFGGVHINSGIPNRAFYLTAAGIGGYAWDAPGHIWYESLKASSAQTRFQDFADTTYWKAEELYGAGGIEQKAVLAAWSEVGILVNGAEAGRERVPAGRADGSVLEDETIAGFIRRIEALSAHAKALAEDVDALTRK
ncbi:M4 family metallopeptidase [Dactylosporangium fulvum]|uniref:Neutral metalloproteinase n=1 Tax=Dactylosporangium fulvum TaxID=53359 RepID=A0ABY5W870_9ACTN|nr:M4 family metallopeptidase [Dactylosporangium fulvum]UWP85550.1 M4 family metallopeptidase [Dactylosporangium fulvum]